MGRGVLGTRRDQLVAGQGNDVVEAARPAGQRLLFRSGVDIPNSEGLIPAARDGLLPIPGQDHRIDAIGVPVQGARNVAGVEIPHLEGPIPGPRDGGAAILRDRYRGHLVGVAGEPPDLIAGPEIPDPERLISRR